MVMKTVPLRYFVTVAKKNPEQIDILRLEFDRMVGHSFFFLLHL